MKPLSERVDRPTATARILASSRTFELKTRFGAQQEDTSARRPRLLPAGRLTRGGHHPDLLVVLLPCPFFTAFLCTPSDLLISSLDSNTTISETRLSNFCREMQQEVVHTLQSLRSQDADQHRRQAKSYLSPGSHHPTVLSPRKRSAIPSWWYADTISISHSEHIPTAHHSLLPFLPCSRKVAQLQLGCLLVPPTRNCMDLIMPGFATNTGSFL